MSVAKRLSVRVGRFRGRRRSRSEDRARERVAQQWAQVLAQRRQQARAERRLGVEPRIEGGPSNFRRAQVPWAVDLAAAWSWRFLVMAAAGYVLMWLVGRFSVVTIPLAVALLVAALATPLVDLGARVGLNRKFTAFLVVVGGLVVVGLMLTFVGTQMVQGARDLAGQVATGLGQIRQWLQEGPLKASDSQINGYIEQVQNAIGSGNGEIVTRATAVGSTVGQIVAGVFIVLFASFFFLADGARIWAWVVRLFPRAARVKTDASGRVAWKSLTQFVRATVLVALVDALGVMLVAIVLKVPFAVALGVLVFLGSFIPLVGATLSGSVAVLVALVAQGPVVALLMLAGVILVQQLEAHVLQPFLLGRFVSVHPLAVIVAIASGALVAGIVGALVAVPCVATFNAVAQYLAEHTDVGDDPVDTGEVTPEPSP